MEGEFELYEGNPDQPLGLYESIKMAPKYKNKPEGIDKFINMFGDIKATLTFL